MEHETYESKLAKAQRKLAGEVSERLGELDRIRKTAIKYGFEGINADDPFDKWLPRWLGKQMTEYRDLENDVALVRDVVKSGDWFDVDDPEWSTLSIARATLVMLRETERIAADKLAADENEQPIDQWMRDIATAAENAGFNPFNDLTLAEWIGRLAGDLIAARNVGDETAERLTAALEKRTNPRTADRNAIADLENTIQHLTAEVEKRATRQRADGVAIKSLNETVETLSNQWVKKHETIERLRLTIAELETNNPDRLIAEMNGWKQTAAERMVTISELRSTMADLTAELETKTAAVTALKNAAEQFDQEIIDNQNTIKDLAQQHQIDLGRYKQLVALLSVMADHNFIVTDYGIGDSPAAWLKIELETLQEITAVMNDHGYGDAPESASAWLSERLGQISARDALPEIGQNIFDKNAFAAAVYAALVPVLLKYGFEPDDGIGIDVWLAEQLAARVDGIPLLEQRAELIQIMIESGYDLNEPVEEWLRGRLQHAEDFDETLAHELATAAAIRPIDYSIDVRSKIVAAKMIKFGNWLMEWADENEQPDADENRPPTSGLPEPQSTDVNR